MLLSPLIEIMEMRSLFPMKIGIDVGPAFCSFKTGIGHYTYHLINYFLNIAPNNEYVFWYQIPLREKLSIPSNVLNQPNVKLIRSRLPARLFALFARYCPKFSFIDALVKVDIFHATNIVGFPLRMVGKRIITIHDISFLTTPSSYTKGTLNRTQLIIRSAQDADLIIADSSSTKKDLVKLLKIPEDKIRVILLGVDSFFHPIDNPDLISRIREKYHLRNDYILYVGTLQPRKNLVRLVEAFHKVQQNANINCQLVLAGGKGWMYKEIFQKVQNLGLEDKVVFTGYVSEEELLVLMNGASVFTLVSLYEGFGLPALEAMACGTPVIASNTSSLPEVVGDAGISVNPYDVDEIAQAIHEVLVNDRLREEMRVKGLEWAKGFSWEKTAKETLKAYEEVINGNSRQSTS